MTSSFVTSRSSQRTIALLRAKLRLAESRLQLTSNKITEIIEFVIDVDTTDREDIVDTFRFVLNKSEEIRLDINGSSASQNEFDDSAGQIDEETDEETDGVYDEETDEETDEVSTHLFQWELEAYDDEWDAAILPNLRDDDEMPPLEDDVVDLTNDDAPYFEHITINGIEYFHDKYGNVTGTPNLLMLSGEWWRMENVAVGVWDSDNHVIRCDNELMI